MPISLNQSKAVKGLRQGDPLSPNLFVLCMEYLNKCLGQVINDKGYHCHPRCKKLNLTHVSFADDLLLFVCGDLQFVMELYKAFQEFSTTSGLKANMAKSFMYFGGVRADIQESICVPLSTKKLYVIQCHPLIQKILSRINSWTAKLLSCAGRVQLIKSVLFSLHTGVRFFSSSDS